MTATSTGAALSVEGLTKRFHTGEQDIVAADELTLQVGAGSFTAVTGPSGSGKSTLLHLIGAIESADAGTIVVDGVEVTALRRRRLSEYRRTVGFVFQRYHLLPALTALDNVIAPVLPFRVDFDKQERARGLLEAVGLGGRERALPAQLSGGQQQRVAIARALIGSPKLLLADEPTGNLDSANGTQILDLLLDLREEHGMTVLLATHEQHIAARCDRLIRLTDGRLTDDIDLTDGEDPSSTLARATQLRL
ncbi:ABC transporter ATP-binding protein [Dactylosporangium siamense]|uniref:Macrolide ABC transporter ATP-binding protein n=1 Tax=Dactylosporangium siamense TaxID=685454 RepID=A0A919Q0L5_9ACTN|nr:ABC transporter ATP-binding protein [Dactylosporangium siamense]GIG51725.1 macrolide ABC transporter ATP-binding protein [Dactylosporangium siamense]